MTATVTKLPRGLARPPHRHGVVPDARQARRARSYDADAESGGTAIVRVQYEHPWVTPVGPAFGGKTITLTKTSRMRIE